MALSIRIGHFITSEQPPRPFELLPLERAVGVGKRKSRLAGQYVDVGGEFNVAFLTFVVDEAFLRRR
jgi:hypothetical protein